MRQLVLDASVILKWFKTDAEADREQALVLRSAYEAGRLAIIVPPLLFLEVLNVAGRQWRWSDAALATLARTLGDFEFTVRNPDLGAVAHWMGTGLTAYDASYVALAEASGVSLVTSDRVILREAGPLARPLADVET